MTTEQVFYLMGLISGGGAMWAGMVVFHWFRERFPRPVDLDDRWQAVRRLNRLPEESEFLESISDEYLMGQLRKANREGLL